MKNKSLYHSGPSFSAMKNINYSKIWSISSNVSIQKFQKSSFEYMYSLSIKYEVKMLKSHPVYGYTYILVFIYYISDLPRRLGVYKQFILYFCNQNLGLPIVEFANTREHII